ncbi:hypothetical protein CA13_52470 [Planctomycetes bacterium CA13]|uniref:Uncharacterized protein n=1 Tax=Novipirellula herctigrandis TaxID=2527986 RepID=A0A5C5Z9K8_9BACT|nr:hypothetical protein CA13_52470 [Planctomycetes bacterium CA13]
MAAKVDAIAIVNRGARDASDTIGCFENNRFPIRASDKFKCRSQPRRTGTDDDCLVAGRVVRVGQSIYPFVFQNDSFATSCPALVPIWPHVPYGDGPVNVLTPSTVPSPASILDVTNRIAPSPIATCAPPG